MTQELMGLKDLIERIKRPVEERKKKARADAFAMKIPNKEFLLISNRELKLQQIRFLINAGHKLNVVDAYTAIAPVYIDLCESQEKEGLTHQFIKCFRDAGFTVNHPEHKYPIRPDKYHELKS